VQTGGCLFCTKTQRGGQTKQRGEYRQRIDDMPRPTPDALTQDRVEDRANGQRQTFVKDGLK